jgi:hypothetical protein
MALKPIGDRFLAEVAEWLTCARWTTGPVVGYTKRVPRELLILCKFQKVMGVTQSDLDRASEEVARRKALPTGDLEVTPPSNPGVAAEAARVLDVVRTVSGAVFTEAKMTCLHEAAHACVAVALGIRVIEASVRPTPASGGFPGSLGRVLHSVLPDPVPLDAWPTSFWVETSVMVSLAGLVLEELIDVNYQAAPLWQSDYVSTMAVLKSVEPDVWLAGDQLERMRNKTAMFLLQPWLMDDIFRVAGLLEERGRLTGRELTTQVYNGQCGAVNPRDTSIRCDIPQQHERGDHVLMSRRDAQPIWSGFGSRPTKKVPVTSLTGPLKSLRHLNLGGTVPLARKWQTTLEEAVDTPLVLVGERFPRAWCQLS